MKHENLVEGLPLPNRYVTTGYYLKDLNYREIFGETSAMVGAESAPLAQWPGHVEESKKN